MENGADALAIEADSIAKHYRGLRRGRKRIVVFHDISVQVRAGETVAVTGPSGLASQLSCIACPAWNLLIRVRCGFRGLTLRIAVGEYVLRCAVNAWGSFFRNITLLIR